MDRYMKFNELKGIQISWNDSDGLDKEITLEEPWEYCKIELIRGFGNVGFTLNNGSMETDYIYIDNNVDKIELSDICVKKLHFKQLKQNYCDNNIIQVTLMR